MNKLNKVALVYSDDSKITKCQENLALYLGGSLALSGCCEQVYFIHQVWNPPSRKKMDKFQVNNTTKEQGNSSTKDYSIVHRSGETFAIPPNVITKSKDCNLLSDCDFVILCVDIGETQQCANIISPIFEKQIVLSAFATFQVIEVSKGLLKCSNQGDLIVERLSKQKVTALRCIELLERTGIFILSRRNIQSIRWGYSLLTTLYAINALTGDTIYETLNNRHCRLICADMMKEGLQVVTKVTRGEGWTPDTSGASILSIDWTKFLFALPNWIFRPFLLLLSFGLVDDPSMRSTMQTDLHRGKSTEYFLVYQDIFELATRHNLEIPCFRQIGKILKEAIEKNEGCPRYSSHNLYSLVGKPNLCRRETYTYLLKWIGIVSLLGLLLLLLFHV